VLQQLLIVLSQYYIDRAEQLQPVIQVAAGQVVDIVFTEGTFIGSQDVKEKIETQRDSSIQIFRTQIKIKERKKECFKFKAQEI
jgi:hypothetical protein